MMDAVGISSKLQLYCLIVSDITFPGLLPGRGCRGGGKKEEENRDQVQMALEKLAEAITNQQQQANQEAEEEEKKNLAATLKTAMEAALAIQPAQSDQSDKQQ